MPIDPYLLGGFLLFSALLSAVPGPSVVLSTGRALTRGRTPALRIVAGNFAGGLVLVVCVIAGLGAVVAASATLFTIVKILGAGYLLWLGCRALWFARRSDPAAFGAAAGPENPSPIGQIREGLLVGLSNPKSLVTLTAILPQFVDPSLGAVPLQLAIIGLAGGLAQVTIETTWVLAAARFRSWFLRRSRRVKVLNGVGGLAMIGLAGKLALQRPTS